MSKNKNQKLQKRSVLSSAILCALGTAQAATISVDGSCSLVEAIEAANTDLPVGTCGAGSGSDVIQIVTPDSNIQITTIFGPGTNGPGDNGLPTISSDITLEGNGSTIRANNSTDAFRLFEVDASGSFTLRNTTVSNANNGNGIGSGLYAYGGTVVIENSTFELNNGAISINGSYENEITNSVIRHNTNSSPRPAGLHVSFAELDINTTSIVDNRHASLPLRGTFSLSGGAFLYQSTVSISNSTISGNQGAYAAGLATSSAPPPPLPLQTEKFENHPMRGVIPDDVQITNSTITSNKANLATGIVQYGNYGILTIRGSIVAGNEIAFNGYSENIYTFNPGGLYLDGNNIIGDASGTGANVPLGASDSSFSNYATDNLYPLTLTNGQLLHPLKVGSAAIDGNDLSCYGSVTDQEGKGRGLDGDSNGSFICDVGSFEHSLPIIVDDAPCTLENAIVSANADSSVGGCQVGNGHDIIMLPENSTQSQASVLGYFNEFPPALFALPNIVTGISIEGNGSTIQRDPGAVDDMDLLLVTDDGQLNLLNTTVTGANGIFGSMTSWYGNINLVDSSITNNQNTGFLDAYSINSSVTGSTVSQNVSYNSSYTYGFGHLATLGSIGFDLNSSTISGNSAYTVAGVDFRSVTRGTIENTTISGNTAVIVGGVVISTFADEQPTFLNASTVTGNEGMVAGGMYVAVGTEFGLQFRNSIISGNILTPPPPRGIESLTGLGLGSGLNEGGTPPIEILSASPYLTLNGNNIIGQNGESGASGATLGPSDFVPPGATSTVIDPLADNGGGMLTHLPVAGGAAVDASPANCGTTKDQLGRIRPWDGDSNGSVLCDVGAVEFGSVTASDLIFKNGFDPVIIMRRNFKR